MYPRGKPRISWRRGLDGEKASSVAGTTGSIEEESGEKKSGDKIYIKKASRKNLSGQATSLRGWKMDQAISMSADYQGDCFQLRSDRGASSGLPQP